MTTLRILIYHGKHGDQYWLADTRTRAAQAREALFKHLDEMGCYEGEEYQDHVEAARQGDAGAIEGLLESRCCCEYEGFDYEYIEVPFNSGVPGVAELLSFNTYQQAAAGTDIYPSASALLYGAAGLAGEGGEIAGKVLDLMEAALRFMKHAGEAANQGKKVTRDDDGVLTSARKDAIRKELGGALWYMAKIAREMGVDLAEVAAGNLAELYSRKARGTIKGDGDDR